MSIAESTRPNPIEQALHKAFFLNHPKDAARRIETMEPIEAAALLQHQQNYVVQNVWKNLPPGVTENILLALPDKVIAELLSNMDSNPCAALLARLDQGDRDRMFALLSEDIVIEINDLLQYPANTAGSMMDTGITAFNELITVEQALIQLRQQRIKDISHLYLLNDNMYLSGLVPVERLALANADDQLQSLAMPLLAYVTALDPKNEILDKLEKFKLDALPVVDGNDRFVGIIRGQNFFDELRDTLSTDMLTMVGVSKEERALSSSWFTVKKRLPWLQINLITAFMAAAVVGMFEDTIAKYTALAILLPIAAGQSGNTGAQALAVTMRALTLREITVRQWPKVLKKEAGAALINGVATAITCGAGVYLWSRSTGLSLIIGLAMISSMLIAAVAGALVPIILKKLGQDPALSSSIILTTVTDIAGFMSFLGIATTLSGMLD